MGGFLRDLRYALRMTTKSLGFSAVAVITLALGIGATVASFSLFEAVEWNWMPYPKVDRVMWLGEAETKAPTYIRDFSGLDYLALQQQSRSFSELAAYDWSANGTLSTAAGPQVLSTNAVTPSLFSLLGTHAALGRLFATEEEKSANSAVAVLTYEAWRKYFGADVKILGTTITLDQQRRTVIGVLPKGFHFWDAEIFVPLETDSADFLNSERFAMSALGRLAPGVTPESATAELNSIIVGLQPQEPPAHRGNTGWLRPITEAAKYYKARLFLFLATAFLVLIIACVNVANLLLARSVERQTEFAVRSALGAGRWALVRQLLAESLLLALYASILGVLLADWGLRAVSAFADPVSAGVLPTNATLAIDGRVLLFATLLAFITAILFGTAPGFLASRVDPERWLKAGPRSQTASRSRLRLREALVIGEVGLALVLTAGGGLFLRSFANLQHTDLGFNPSHLLTVHLNLAGSRYENLSAVRQFYEELLQKARAMPGVEAAVVANYLPMTSGWGISFTVVGGAPANPTDLRNRGAMERAVMPGFFRVMGIPILRGRAIAERDTASSSLVVVINENLARRYFGAVDPLGRQLLLELRDPKGQKQQQKQIAEIIGVVRNVHEVGINEADFDSIYLPFAQHPEAGAYLAVRTHADPRQMTALIRKEIDSLDPTLPVYGLPTMQERIDRSLGGDRFNTTVIVILASVALLLSLLGIFAVIAYNVSQRVHEIGIRMALGATGEKVLTSIVGHSGRLVIAGVGAGLVAVLLIGKFLGDVLFLVPGKHEGMLYGVTLHDPLTLAAAAVLLGMTALAASYAPARRATKVDPMEALRCE
ncbi:MAG TPA: ABC transporter permease [Terriglobales bacterium]|nr:ABC transporter permease [Terriglobales bacterium]